MSLRGPGTDGLSLIRSTLPRKAAKHSQRTHCGAGVFLLRAGVAQRVTVAAVPALPGLGEVLEPGAGYAEGAVDAKAAAVSSSAGRRVGDGPPARPGWHDACVTLPTPCPADLVPEATGLDAYTAVYQQAKRQRAVFVAVECQAQRWTVKVDTLTAGPSYAVDDSVIEPL